MSLIWPMIVAVVVPVNASFTAFDWEGALFVSPLY
jgi:hypothetical protein